MKVSGFDLILKIGKPSFWLQGDFPSILGWEVHPLFLPHMNACDFMTSFSADLLFAESPRYYLSSEAFGWRRLLIHVVTWAALGQHLCRRKDTTNEVLVKYQLKDPKKPLKLAFKKYLYVKHEKAV